MRTNNLCADIGYMSLNHDGENLCGDHVEMVETEDKPSTVIVLADGLGIAVGPVAHRLLDQMQLLDVPGNGGLGGLHAAGAQLGEQLVLGLHVGLPDDAQDLLLPS